MKLALLFASVQADDALYSQTPAGEVLSHCMHEVPSGSTVTELSDGTTLVESPDGSSFLVPVCDTRNGTLQVLRHRGDGTANPQNVASVSSQPNPLPPGYDGWLQYTAYKDEGGFDSFVGEMSVPDIPKAEPQLLYLFPGLQNIDWIPKASIHIYICWNPL